MNSPRGKRPQKQGSSRLTWLFFLLILARPLWGILRGMVGPAVSDGELWLLIAGTIGLGLVVTLVLNLAGRRSSDTQLPTGPGTAGPRAPTWDRSAPPAQPIRLPTPSGPGYPTQPPQFEPIITGKVVVAGLVLATIFGAAFLLLVLG